MKKILLLLALAVSFCPINGQSQATTGFYRQSQVIARASSGVTAQVVPYATVVVTNTATGSAAVIYSDPLLTAQITPAVVYTDASGNYGYYLALGTIVTETISSPGQGLITIPNVGLVSNGLTNPVTVPEGGTGLTSLVPYAILAGGATSTGNIQQVSGLGSPGQVLISGGAGALATWSSSLPGGPFLPLAGGTMTGALNSTFAGTNTLGSGNTATWDFSGSEFIKVPVWAGCTTTASGQTCHDSTNHNWHDYDNGVDNFVALFPSASPPTSGHLAEFLKTGNVWTLADGGAVPAVGVYGGAGLSATSSSPNGLAIEYGNGTTTGIAGCATTVGANGTCVANPTYPSTEQPTTISFSANPFHYQDDRKSSVVDFFRNPSQSLWQAAFYQSGINYFGKLSECLLDGLTTITSAQACQGVQELITQPGYSLGPNGLGGGVGWMTAGGLALSAYFNNAGISTPLSASYFKFGLGDNASWGVLSTTHNGATAPADEGTFPANFEVTEDAATGTGTCSTGCTTGSTSIKITPVLGANTLGVGQMVIDTTQSPVLSGTYSAIGAGLAGGSAITVTGATESVAWGHITSNVATPLNNTPPFSTSETFTVTISGGTGGSGGQYDTTHLACWAGNYHDCAFPTAVGSVGGGTQSVTMPLRRPHASGSYLFQGGTQGGFEATSYTESPNGQPLRYLYDVVGAINSTTLEVGQYYLGLYQVVRIPSNSYQKFNVSSGVTNGGSGTTVTFFWAGSGALNAPYLYNGNSVTFAGLSDSALNTVCTGVTWVNAKITYPPSATCTIAGLSGSHTDSTGGTAVFALNGYKVWPMAEALDVQNETLTPPQMDGTIELEPSTIAFGSGDTVEQTHHVSSEIRGEDINVNSFDPYSFIKGLDIIVQGAGEQGGGQETGNAMVNITNGNSDSGYVGSGGTQQPMNAFNVNGPYAYGISFNEGPASGNPLINVQPTATQLADLNYIVPVWNVLDASGANYDETIPATGNQLRQVEGTDTMYSPVSHTFSGSPVNSVLGYVVNGAATSGDYLRCNGTACVVGAIQAGDLPISAPVNNPVTSATGGTNTGTVTCLTASCTNISGTYSVVGSTFTTGNLLVLVWPTTTAVYKCWTSQNGGVATYGIGHSVATATGMTITAGITVTGVTVTIDYGCSQY